MQIAVGVPTFRNCVLNVPSASNTWIAPVALVGDVDVALRIDGDAVHDVELAGRRAARAPRLDVLAGRLVLRDPRVAVAVGDVDVAGGVPRDVGRPLEALARGARARQRAAATGATRQPPALHLATRRRRQAAGRRRDRRRLGAGCSDGHHRYAGAGVNGSAGTRIASGLRLSTICTRPFGSNLITCVDI